MAPERLERRREILLPAPRQISQVFPMLKPRHKTVVNLIQRQVMRKCIRDFPEGRTEEIGHMLFCKQACAHALTALSGSSTSLGRNLGV